MQYLAKVIVPILRLRARLQYRAGIRADTNSKAAGALSKLSSIIGDSRTLWRIWGENFPLGFSLSIASHQTSRPIKGLLPILQWLISLERNPQPTHELLTIERLQAWSMLAQYPLEYLHHFCSHGIIPSTIPSLRFLFSSTAKPITLDLDVLGIWSSRLWALYVLLQFAHLREDRKLLKMRERSLRKAKGSSISASEKEELRQRWDAYWNEVVVNIGYLPLTIHWYVPRSSGCIPYKPTFFDGHFPGR